jgi:hypothetical protein
VKWKDSVSLVEMSFNSCVIEYKCVCVCVCVHVRARVLIHWLNVRDAPTIVGEKSPHFETLFPLVIILKRTKTVLQTYVTTLVNTIKLEAGTLKSNV